MKDQGIALGKRNRKSGAPTGRTMKDQGIALGKRNRKSGAPTGRSIASSRVLLFVNFVVNYLLSLPRVAIQFTRKFTK